MKKSERLTPVLKLEEMKEQQAVKRYADARVQCEQEKQKLQQLIEYSKEYQEMIEEKGRVGIAADRLQSYHRFINKLNQAITQQQQQLLLVQQEAEQQEQYWLRQRGATINMDNLVSRYARDERLVTDKKEQKEMDEQAQQMAGLSLF
ncbi:MAG: flagellar export protein FliJ [Pseudomonadales bacterium]|nr:flagellar export protein FliJ [Pseudomonadales bacterium]MCP5215365.1 flagellar export protein FliJ [Pseudomonadales bacterium]